MKVPNLYVANPPPKEILLKILKRAVRVKCEEEPDQDWKWNAILATLTLIEEEGKLPDNDWIITCLADVPGPDCEIFKKSYKFQKPPSHIQKPEIVFFNDDMLLDGLPELDPSAIRKRNQFRVPKEVRFMQQKQYLEQKQQQLADQMRRVANQLAGVQKEGPKYAIVLSEDEASEEEFLIDTKPKKPDKKVLVANLTESRHYDKNAAQKLRDKLSKKQKPVLADKNIDEEPKQEESKLIITKEQTKEQEQFQPLQSQVQNDVQMINEDEDEFEKQQSISNSESIPLGSNIADEDEHDETERTDQNNKVSHRVEELSTKKNLVGRKTDQNPLLQANQRQSRKRQRNNASQRERAQSQVPNDTMARKANQRKLMHANTPDAQAQLEQASANSRKSTRNALMAEKRGIGVATATRASTRQVSTESESIAFLDSIQASSQRSLTTRGPVADPAARGGVNDIYEFTAADAAAYEEAIAIIGSCMAISHLYFHAMLLQCPYALF